MNKHIYYTLRQARKARIQSQEYNKRHVYSYAKKTQAKNQRRSTTEYDLHGNTYTIVLLQQTGATHSHLHKTQKEKEVTTSLSVSSSLWRPQLRVPPAWSTGSCLAPARVVRPTARTGFRGNGRVFRRFLVRTGWGDMAGARHEPSGPRRRDSELRSPKAGRHAQRSRDFLFFLGFV